jgi:hypothetical protein
MNLNPVSRLYETMQILYDGIVKIKKGENTDKFVALMNTFNNLNIY